MAGLKDIAQRTGISINTASRALRGVGYVSASAREKILASAKELNYQPNRAARSLRTNHNYRIAVITFMTDKSFMCDYLHVAKVVGINKVTIEAGYDVAMHFMQNNNKSTDVQLKRIISDPPAGIILIGGGSFALGIYKQISSSMIPIVAVTYGAEKRIDSVFLDRNSGVREAVLYMAGRGREKIAYAGPLWDTSRIAGYRKALSVLNMPEMIYDVKGYSVTSLQKIHQLGVNVALEIAGSTPRPDAVQTYSDYLAAGMLEGFRKAGLSVPEDIAVCGFDDRELAQSLDPGLTTVAQPSQEVGEHAAGMLLEKIKQGNKFSGDSVSIPMKLTIREST